MDSNCTGSDFCETGSDMFWTGSDIFMTGNDIYGSGSKFGVAESEIYGTGNDLNRKKPWFLEIFEIFVFQSRFCPWIRSKFKNRATSCTLSGFVAYSCKFSRLCVRPIVLDASDKLFPQFATVTLKLGQGQIFFLKLYPGPKYLGTQNFVSLRWKLCLWGRSAFGVKKNGNS